jgi:hypothetical protein
VGESFLPRRVVALLAQAREYGVKIAPKPNRTFPDHDLEITGPGLADPAAEARDGHAPPVFLGCADRGCGPRA